MEIKGIGGAYSAYKINSVNAQKKKGAAVTADKLGGRIEERLDKVSFGFEAAIAAAKTDIADAVNANAGPRELLDAANSANEITNEQLAALIMAR